MATYKGHNEDSSGNILLSIGNGMTATVETGSTASQAYTKGAYIFFNNRFCKATAAIASGATLAIGTNLSETSVGAELTSHLRSSDGKEFYFDVKDGTYGYYPSAEKTASEFVPFGGTTGIVLSFANAVFNVIDISAKQGAVINFDGTARTITVNGISYTVRMVNGSTLDIGIKVSKSGKYIALTQGSTPSTVVSLSETSYTANTEIVMRYSSSGNQSGLFFIPS